MKRVLVGLGAACVLALCLIGLVLVVRLLRTQTAVRRFVAAGPANLAREEAAARQEGIPLTSAQLQRPLPPPSQNAAPLYVKLTKLLHDKPLNLPKYAETLNAFQTYTPEQIAFVRRTLAERQDVMTLVHQAADRPQCVFGRDWNKGAKLEFPEYPRMREAARLIKDESYLLARDGHYEEAIVNQARGFRIAEHAASDHLLLAYLVGVACEAITLAGMQSIMTQAGPNAAVDASVRQAVDAKRPRLSLRAAMAGEAGFDCLQFPKMHQAEKMGLPAVLKAAGLTADQAHLVQASGSRLDPHGLVDAWEADYLRRMLMLVRASDQPLALRRGVFEASAKQTLPGSDPGEVGYVFGDILLPVFSKIDQNDTRTQARTAVMLAAAVILAQKAKTGAYPDKLPQEFIDPFTGRPLGYRREGDTGFAVYSAGPTGHFDGSQPGQKVPGQESLFRYPAVPTPPN